MHRKVRVQLSLEAIASDHLATEQVSCNKHNVGEVNYIFLMLSAKQGRFLYQIYTVLWCVHCVGSTRPSTSELDALFTELLWTFDFDDIVYPLFCFSTFHC